MDQSRQDFLLEIEELIEYLFADLDHLRAKQDEGPTRRRLLQSIFRRVHSIKGSAASSGLDQTSRIAHRIENLLSEIRAGRVGVNDKVLDALEDSANVLAHTLTTDAPVELTTTFNLLGEVEQANQTSAPLVFESLFQTLPTEVSESLTQAQKSYLNEILKEGSSLFDVAASFAVADFDLMFQRLKDRLEEFGEVVATHPSINAKDPDTINFRLLYVSQTDLRKNHSALRDFPDLEINRLTDNAAEASETGDSSTSSSQLTQHSVRLDLNQLDRLISSSHELFGKTANALELAIRNAAREDARAALLAMDAEIMTSSLAVQEQIINLRMVSIGRILKRAERAGRATARQAGKSIAFETIGLELRLDRLLAEAIANPLVHLVCNAVDHGIETEEERKNLGKNARGLIRIQAVTEGSLTRIRVSDDGRGIDPVLVSRTAAESGLIGKDVLLDLEQSLRMIFRSGFTTVKDVSTSSGRGVGLDVVEASVEEVGGDVRVFSRPGLGSRFEIHLPMTFGLLQSTVILSNGHHYCLDADKIISSAFINQSTIELTSEGEQFFAAGQALPVVRLRHLLEQPPIWKGERSGQILICQLPTASANDKAPSARRIALAVDEVRGVQPVLTRNLGSHAGRWYGIAGATELRDGSVALVLDLHRLLSSADS